MIMRVVEIHTVTINGGLVKRFKQREAAQACLDELARERSGNRQTFSPLRIEHGFALEVDTPNGPVYFHMFPIAVEP